MISKNQMFPLILEACPSFRPAWNAFVESWEEEEEDLPYYIALTSLARHLIHKLSANEIEEFKPLFHVIEKFHIEGDYYVKQAATVGLLEDLQNTGLHESTNPEQFRPYLLPDSVKWWDKLYKFWDEGKLLTDD